MTKFKFTTLAAIALYAMLAAGLSSCSNDRTRELPISDNSNSFQEVAKQFPVNANGDVKVVSIDSCEYIVWGGSHGEIGYAHKGNCKWCMLRQPCH
jgi:uncharacterized lipoprotein